MAVGNSIFLWRRCLALGVLSALLILLCSCSGKPDPKLQSAAKSTIGVTVAKAELRPMERTITVMGSFTAREGATLSVKVPGRLESIAVDIGSVVKRGDLLAQIDRADYELRVNQAEGVLAQAKARLGLQDEAADTVDLEKTPIVQQAKALLTEAAKSRDRIRELAESKVLSQSELDTVEAAYIVSFNKYQDALQDVRERRALVVERRADLKLAQKQLSDTTIRAPFAGLVQQRQASSGEFLATGTPLLVIADVDPLRLRLEVPERESLQIATNQVLRAFVGNNTNSYTARITRVSPMLSSSNRVLVVEADLPAAPALRPGLFVQAAIVVNPNDPAVCIPESAVSSFVGIQKVFVLREGKAEERSISTGRRKSGLVEVLSGVKAGEVVILHPGPLKSGQAVVIEESNAKAR